MARRSVTIDMEIRNKQARKALQGVESGFTRLSQKSQQSTTAMSQGFNRASQQVQGSQAAVSNLSRIVEDAPFGVRGVANNINPFIQSFGRLKQQAGSTGAAMKTLLTSAFTGPGAILTISALVTSAITAIQMGLFDLGEEAKDTLEEIDGLLGSFERTIELQEQFGAFEDDEFGIDKMQAEIREITEDIKEQREQIEFINSLEEERRQIVQQAARGEQIDTQRLEEIDTILDRELSISEIEEEIKSLQQERLQLSQDLANTADAIADSDTQQAKQQQEAREEQEKRTEAAQSELEAARALNRARREMAAEARGQGAEFLGPADIDVGLDTSVRDTKIGTIADMKAELRGLNQELQNTRIGSQRFEELQTEIANVEGQLNQATDSFFDLGNTGRESLVATSRAANMLGNALAQAIVRGEELEGVLKSLAAQLASQAFIKVLTAILTSGGSIGKDLAGFGAGIFDTSTEGTIGFGQDLLGFAHGADGAFPGMGIVGERGEELLVAPPMSSIITNENVEKMHQMQREAKNGATRSMSGIDTGAIAEAVRAGIEVADIKAPVEISRVKRELGVYEELQNRIGN